MFNLLHSNTQDVFLNERGLFSSGKFTCPQTERVPERREHSQGPGNHPAAVTEGLAFRRQPRPGQPGPQAAGSRAAPAGPSEQFPHGCHTGGAVAC